MYKEPYNINYFKRRHFDAGAYFYADTNCMQKCLFQKNAFLFVYLRFFFFLQGQSAVLAQMHIVIFMIHFYQCSTQKKIHWMTCLSKAT